MPTEDCQTEVDFPAFSHVAQWPPEARLILSAIKAAQGGADDNRRTQSRITHHVCAQLRLFSDPDGSAPWKVYTRDVDARSVGFITPYRLPLGYGGVVELQGPDGRTVEAHCTLFRCRQTARGWYEGALSFHRPQWCLIGGEPHDPNDEFE